MAQFFFHCSEGAVVKDRGSQLFNNKIQNKYYSVDHLCIRVVGPSLALFTPPLKIFLGRTPPLGDQKEGWRAGRQASPSQPSFRGPDLFFEFSLKFYPPPGRPKRGLGGLGEGWPTGQPPPPYFRCLGRCPVTLRGSELRVIFYFDLTKTLVINWVK